MATVVLTRKIANREAFQHPADWTAGSRRLLDYSALLAPRGAWRSNTGVGHP
jgi:hypothetical protein